MSKRTSQTWILAMTLPVIFLASRSPAQLPAFPGADGAGQFASGGRGGIVYHVTKLNLAVDDPARTNYGTFLYGLNGANFPAGVPRTIVFDVAGVFHLGGLDRTNWTSGGNAWDATSRQSISSSNLTIAGQTAPGPVIFMGGTLKPSGSNIVIRNITIAAGYGMKNFWEPPPKTPPLPGTLPTSFTMDAMDVTGHTIMIDHLDAFYCTDEVISCNERAENLTIQCCSNSQGQNYNAHALGHLLQADTDHKISFLHNLDAHLDNRLPRVGSEVGTGALNDFRNNVFFNWLGAYGYAGYAGAFAAPSQYSKNNFIHNFYLAGNGGDANTTNTSGGGTLIFYGYQSYGTPIGPTYTAVYPAGNLQDLNKDGDPNDAISADGSYFDSVIQSAAYDIDIGVTLNAHAAFTNVLRYVGSRWWERDYDITLGNTNAIDTIGERIIHEVITGTGRVEAWADDPFDNDPNEGVEWRALWALRPDTNGVAPFNRPAGWDTDQDGMPDSWEIEHGLNPNVADNNGDFDSDGYSNLEEYLNDIAAWPAPGDIRFTGATNNRYALIFNWQVNGVQVNVSGLGVVTTSSKWQPSRYDTAIVSNASVLLDAVGQHAGVLRLVHNATLNITNGWLKVADTLEIGAAGVAEANLAGGLLCVGTLALGAGDGSFNFTGGTLRADIVDFDLINRGGVIAPGSGPGQTHVRGDLTLQAGSSLAFELGGTGPGQSDAIIVDGNLTLAGTLSVTNLSGFGAGIYILITYGGVLDGSLAIGSTPTGYRCTLDTNTPTQVRLVVAELPVFERIDRVDSNLVISGTGPANGTYHLLTSTEVDQPLSLWATIATNAFDAAGQFSITNLIDFNQPQTFYRLKLP